MESIQKILDSSNIAWPIKIHEFTKKISSVLAVTEPSGGLFPGKVDAVVGEISFGEGELEMIVVAHIHQWVSKHEESWSQLSFWKYEQRWEDDEETTEKKTQTVIHCPSLFSLSLSSIAKCRSGRRGWLGF